MSADSSVIDDIKAFIRSLVTYAEPVEHIKFFNFGFSMNTRAATEFANRFVATCYAVNNDPGFGLKRTIRLNTAPSFDAEFAKAGLGVIVRDPSGSTNISLRTSNHLEGKADARDALRNMAPSRRSALVMEINKINVMPASAFSLRDVTRPASSGVRG
jgi:hypothetical protein